MDAFFVKYFIDDESLKRFDLVCRGIGNWNGTGRIGSLINAGRDRPVDDDDGIEGTTFGSFLRFLLGNGFG